MRRHARTPAISGPRTRGFTTRSRHLARVASHAILILPSVNVSRRPQWLGVMRCGWIRRTVVSKNMAISLRERSWKLRNWIGLHIWWTLQIHIHFITIILVNEIILNKAEKRLFTTYKKFPENPVGMFQTENLCSISSNPYLITVSGLRGGFSVNGTHLCKW